jgi:histidinol-phosphate aminotransferase
MSPKTTGPRPVPVIAATQAYKVGRHPAPIDLFLDGNEGQPPPASLLAALSEAGPELLRRYPNARTLESELAEIYDVSPERVLVTAGADDALDRLCRTFLNPGRELILPVPTFEMIARYARLTGGTIREVDWAAGGYPTEGVLSEVNQATALIAMVSPNNPTGGAATVDDLRSVSTGAPRAAVVVDLAYGEFADEDLTPTALTLPNVVVTRTLSKAWGLAGLRVGFAIGPAELIEWLRRAGQPYAVSATSVFLARARLAERPDITPFVTQIKKERRAVRESLTELGVEALPSQANFIFARTPRRAWLRDGLAGLGIAVRVWPEHEQLDQALRITCPGDDADRQRLEHALGAVLAPEAILFDMDGVLADVRPSYRQAILDCAQSFDVELTPDDVAEAKAAGDANNDWVLTQRLLATRGREVPFEDVKARFEALYQGTDDRPGLWNEETLIPSRQSLERLAAARPLGIVTGRPRHDAERFLAQHDLGGLFQAVVCMEDAPLKPDPAPVKLACEQLGISRAWMVGDTPDDLRAARAAGVVPIGFDVMDADREILLQSGGARVLSNLEELLEMLK